MAVEAELFDGTILEFPDGTDPSIVQSKAKEMTLARQPRQVAPPAPPTPGLADRAKNAAKDLGRGIVDVGTQIASGPRQLLNETAAEPTTPPKPGFLDKPIAELLPQAANTVAGLFKGDAGAAIKRGAGYLMPDFQAASNAITSIPEESSRLNPVIRGGLESLLQPVLGQSGRGISEAAANVAAPVVAAGRGLLGAPFALAPKVVNQTLAQPMEAVKEGTERGAKALGASEPIAKLLSEVSPDVLMVAGAKAIHSAMAEPKADARAFIKEAGRQPEALPPPEQAAPLAAERPLPRTLRQVREAEAPPADVFDKVAPEAPAPPPHPITELTNEIRALKDELVAQKQAKTAVPTAENAVPTPPIEAPTPQIPEQTAKPAAQVGKPPTKEVIDTPVIMANGEPIKGRTHGEAINNALDSGAITETAEGYVDKAGKPIINDKQFLTNEGRIIDRNEVDRLFYREAFGEEPKPPQVAVMEEANRRLGAGPVKRQIPPAEQKTGIVPRGGTEPAFATERLTDPGKASIPEEPQFTQQRRGIGGILSSEKGELGFGKEAPPPVPEPAARVLEHVSVNEKTPRAPTLEKLYTKALDDLEPVRKFAMEVGEGKLKPSEDPYVLARTFRGWMGKADSFLKTGPIDFDTLEPKAGVKPLGEILKPFEGNLDDLRAYMTAKRALELQGQGRETGIPIKDAADTVAAYANRPDLARAAGEIKSYNNSLLEYAEKSGLLSKESVGQIKAANQEYVPFHRLFEEGEVNGPFTGKSFTNVANPIKKLVGSERTIIDPLEDMVKGTYTIINAAERNNVGQALAKLADQDTLGKFMREVPKEDAGLGNVVSVKVGGQAKHYQVEPDLFGAVSGLNKTQQNMLVRFLSIPARGLRLGATTLSPEFSLRNPLRDQWSATINSEYGYRPGIDFMRGLFSVIKHDAMYKAWKAGGGEGAALVSMDRTHLQSTLKELANSSKNTSFVKSIVSHPIESLRMVSELGEAATRVGEFTRAIDKEGGLSKENIIKGALASREVTLDFARMGETVKASGANQLVAFLNANMQDIDKMGRAFKNHPGRTLAKAVATVTLPSLALWTVNHDDPRYQELPSWQRDLFWVIPSGHMDRATWDGMNAKEKAAFNKEHTIWRIPKPFQMGMLFGSSVERTLDWAYSNDPKALTDFAKTFISSFPTPIPTAALPPLENFANYSVFRGRPIVPRGKESTEPWMQYGSYTSETAKKVGKAINYSPNKIENLVQGWTASLGKTALGLGDAALDMGGVTDKAEKPEGRLSDVTGLKAFVVKSPDQSRSVEQFFDRLKESEKLSNTAQALKRENKTAEYKAYASENRSKILEHKPLTTISEVLSKARKKIDQVREDRNLSPAEKRDKIDELDFRMQEIAKDTLTKLDKFREKQSRKKTLEELGLR